MTKTEMDQDQKLNCEEKKLLKEEIHKVWEEFPMDLKKVIYETKKHKLSVLYMIENWAKENGHQVIVDLISRRIACKEEKLAKMAKELGEE